MATLERGQLMLFRRIVADEYIASGVDAKGNDIISPMAYIKRTVENASLEYDKLTEDEKTGMLQYIRSCMKNKEAGRKLRDFSQQIEKNNYLW